MSTEACALGLAIGVYINLIIRFGIKGQIQLVSLQHVHRGESANKNRNYNLNDIQVKESK